VTAGSEYWQLLVYCSDNARGSPTGVVFPNGLSSGRYQATAAALGCPDTVFLTPGSNEAEWNARSFSPAQELSLCTQALIAAFRVLQRKHNGPELQRVLFQTPSGPVVVSELVAQQRDIAWLIGPYRILEKRVANLPLDSQQDAGNRRGVVIDTGRTRLFRQVRDEKALAAISIDPAHVMKYCAAEEIGGICLFAQTGDREVRMRVFTTSQDGREDISTGGAAMGLLPYIGMGDSLPKYEPWTVQQGFGPYHQQGTLFTMLLSEPGMVAVGGRHRFVAGGTLL
jgi:PhzF family phenazine biosynthesis protein